MLVGVSIVFSQQLECLPHHHHYLWSLVIYEHEKLTTFEFTCMWQVIFLPLSNFPFCVYLSLFLLWHIWIMISFSYSTLFAELLRQGEQCFSPNLSSWGIFFFFAGLFLSSSYSHCVYIGALVTFPFLWDSVHLLFVSPLCSLNFVIFNLLSENSFFCQSNSSPTPSWDFYI